MRPENHDEVPDVDPPRDWKWLEDFALSRVKLSAEERAAFLDGLTEQERNHLLNHDWLNWRDPYYMTRYWRERVWPAVRRYWEGTHLIDRHGHLLCRECGRFKASQLHHSRLAYVFKGAELQAPELLDPLCPLHHKERDVSRELFGILYARKGPHDVARWGKTKFRDEFIRMLRRGGGGGGDDERRRETG